MAARGSGAEYGRGAPGVPRLQRPRRVKVGGVYVEVAGCKRCERGSVDSPCTCLVQDRCAEVDDDGHQCCLGVGHTLKHVTGTGVYWA
jgi:hypothetical protein